MSAITSSFDSHEDIRTCATCAATVPENDLVVGQGRHFSALAGTTVLASGWCPSHYGDGVNPRIRANIRGLVDTNDKVQTRLSQTDRDLLFGSYQKVRWACQAGSATEFETAWTDLHHFCRQRGVQDDLISRYRTVTDATFRSEPGLVRMSIPSAPGWIPNREMLAVPPSGVSHSAPAETAVQAPAEERDDALQGFSFLSVFF